MTDSVDRTQEGRKERRLTIAKRVAQERVLKRKARAQKDDQGQVERIRVFGADGVEIVPNSDGSIPLDSLGSSATKFVEALLGMVVENTGRRIRVYSYREEVPILEPVSLTMDVSSDQDLIILRPRDKSTGEDIVERAVETVIRTEMWWLVLGLASRMSRLNDMRRMTEALNDADVALKSLGAFNQKLEASSLWFRERAVGISHFERLRQTMVDFNERGGQFWDATRRLDALQNARQWLDLERRTNDDAGVGERCESETIILIGLARMLELPGKFPELSAVRTELDSAVRTELDWLEEGKKESKEALAREHPEAGPLVEYYGNGDLEHVAGPWERWVAKIALWSAEFETSMQGELSSHFQESPLERVQSRIRSVEDPTVTQRLEQVYAAFEPYAHGKGLPAGTTPQIMNFLLVSASVPGLWERLDSKDPRIGDALLGSYAQGLSMTKLAETIPGITSQGLASYLVRRGLKKLFEWMPEASQDFPFDKHHDFPLDQMLTARNDRMRVTGENRARDSRTSEWGKMAAARRWWTAENDVNDGTGESLTPED